MKQTIKERVFKEALKFNHPLTRQDIIMLHFKFWCDDHQYYINNHMPDDHKNNLTSPKIARLYLGDLTCSLTNDHIKGTYLRGPHSFKKISRNQYVPNI